jgi:hypothetical protein
LRALAGTRPAEDEHYRRLLALHQLISLLWGIWVY